MRLLSDAASVAKNAAEVVLQRGPIITASDDWAFCFIERDAAPYAWRISSKWRHLHLGIGIGKREVIMLSETLSFRKCQLFGGLADRISKYVRILSAPVRQLVKHFRKNSCCGFLLLTP